jgi:hypothetical protein
MTVGEKTGVFLEAPEAPMFLQEKNSLKTCVLKASNETRCPSVLK